MIVLQYNPYSQTAEIKHKNEGNGNTSELIHLSKHQKDALNMLKKDIILQNQIKKLIDVLKEIDSSQRFSFIGTEKDYHDFSEGVKKFAPGGVVEKTDSPFFYEATKIEERLSSICKAVLNDVIALNQKYPENCNILHFDSTGINAALNDRTPLVFIGKGSTGKSSVINALIGAEVLPTGDGTTTEAVCEIIPDEDRFEVSYRYSNSVCKLDFNKSKEEAELSLKNAFGIEVDLATENPYDWVYQAVELINKQEDITDFQIRIPFKNLTEISKKIVIYDTPGPDSKTRVNHKNVLNEALSHFVKGVAVFVTSPTEIEKTNLRCFLKEYTENATELLEILNVNAGIVIINGADKSNLEKINMGNNSRKEHLQKGEDDVTRLEFQFEEDRRIYFSSPYALGIHKEQGAPWMDSVFKKVNRHSECMDTPGDDDYLPLATVAELPFLRQKAVRDEYEKAEQRYKNDKSEDNRRELIAHNSGLRALEYELGFVVKELSICNLCAQAQKQLEAILDSVKDSTTEINKTLSVQKQQHRYLLDERYKDILNRLFYAQNSELNKAVTTVSQNVGNAVKPDTDTMHIKAIEEVKKAIDCQWREVKKNPQVKIKDIILNSTAIACIQEACNAKAEQYYHTAFERFKDGCQKIVCDSNAVLSSEEQAALEKCMKKWQAVKFDRNKVKISEKEVKSQILFFNFTSKSKCYDVVEPLIFTIITNQTQKAANSVKEFFQISCTNSKDSFYTEEKIKAANPELRALSEQIDKLNKQQQDYQHFQYEVESHLTTVSELTKLQQKGEE